MREIDVKTNKPYKVLVGENILGDDIFKYFPAFSKKAVIIWDEAINPKPVEALGEMLEKHGIECLALSVRGGEECKTLETFARIVDHLANFKVDKTNLLIAVGGGTVSDLTGFVASTYMRGLKVVNVPTTLLSQVDAAIGGKTALNYNQYKNLIGTINQPNLVVCDTAILKGLDDKNFSSGVSEIVKIAFMKDKALAEKLKDMPLILNRDNNEYLEEVVSRAIELKAEIVAGDELNSSERNILNFGHTFGHAIESESKYMFGHGEAVSLGMVIITKMAESGKLGDNITEKGTLAELKEILKANRLKVDSPYDLKTLIKSVLHDKKVSGDNILLALPTKVGEGKLVSVPLARLK